MSLNWCCIDRYWNNFVKIIGSFEDWDKWKNKIWKIINFVIPLYTKCVRKLNFFQNLALFVDDFTIRSLKTDNEDLVVNFLRSNKIGLELKFTSFNKQGWIVLRGL